MNITDLVSEKTMTIELTADSKDSVLEELAELLDDAGKLKDKSTYLASVQARENEGSTGIGFGVAIPHGKSVAVAEPAIAFGRSKSGVDFDSMDGKPSKMFFMIAVPDSADNLHLQTLAKLSRKLMHESFRDELLNAESKQEVLSVLSKMDEA